MSHRVIVSVADGVAEVKLNRADKRNALDPAMFLAIAEAGDRLRTQAGVRCVVLYGDGPSFCAGLDFASLGQLAGREPRDGPSGDPLAEDESRITHLGQQVCWVWQEVPVPVIAAVHGHALGGGLQIALGADIRIAHPDTQLSVREVHWGLVPDMTGTFTLSRLVRPDVARELTYTARVLPASEGFELGLVTRLSDDPLADARALAAQIAGRSPDAVRGAKELFGRIDNAGAAEQFAAERTMIRSLIGSPNQREAVAASFENRQPNFVD